MIRHTFSLDSRCSQLANYGDGEQLCSEIDAKEQSRIEMGDGNLFRRLSVDGWKVLQSRVREDAIPWIHLSADPSSIPITAFPLLCTSH